mmetsp:Transcript_3876/g.10122  ORF Transcript_3876/g.10122 Transcript_3876/m.10122 type:complete len:305 (-) Transcript_3876:175-1089(-)
MAMQVSLCQLADRSIRSALARKLGRRVLSFSGSPVSGEIGTPHSFLAPLRSHSSMARRSYVLPSAVETGSTIGSCVIGQTTSSERASARSLSAACSATSRSRAASSSCSRRRSSSRKPTRLSTSFDSTSSQSSSMPPLAATALTGKVDCDDDAEAGEHIQPGGGGRRLALRRLRCSWLRGTTCTGGGAGGKEAGVSSHLPDVPVSAQGPGATVPEAKSAAGAAARVSCAVPTKKASFARAAGSGPAEPREIGCAGLGVIALATCPTAVRGGVARSVASDDSRTLLKKKDMADVVNFFLLRKRFS